MTTSSRRRRRSNSNGMMTMIRALLCLSYMMFLIRVSAFRPLRFLQATAARNEGASFVSTTARSTRPTTTCTTIRPWPRLAPLRGGRSGELLWNETTYYEPMEEKSNSPYASSETTQKRFLDLPKRRTPQSMEDADLRDDGDAQLTESSSSIHRSSIVATSTKKNTSTLRYVRRQAQKGVGGFIAVGGFMFSATRAVVTNRGQWGRLKPTVDSFKNFLKQSGIDLELSRTLNFRLLDNLVILSRIQKILVHDKDIRDFVTVSWAFPRIPRVVPTSDEALRYMKYATSAYGDSMILAADIHRLGQHDITPDKLTKKRVSEHIGVPEDDIVVMDIDYGGDSSHLRHFVAVDHANKKVVLAMRGTFSLGEVVVDVAGFSRPFCGGEAHSEMANMAEKVWEKASPDVLEFLEQNQGYDLVITGHSLGGGVACLINILCHKKRLVPGRQVQCFAYAAPPVYTPLSSARDAVLSCTNFIHGKDCVPFLSVDAVRHLFKCIGVIQAHPECQNWLARMRLVTGYREPSAEFVEEVRRASTERLKVKEAAPLLVIPAAANVWLNARPDDGDAFDFKVCDPLGVATLGIQVHRDMMIDHFPSQYEQALHHIVDEKKGLK